ncbi:MAG: hypothetical protein GY811_05640 [Myxococcales bacterium]|nr:hypothetical protein [Myxococcales bacterium]
MSIVGILCPLACGTATSGRGPKPPATLDHDGKIVEEASQSFAGKDSQRKMLELTVEPIDYGPRFSERVRPVVSPITSNEIVDAIVAETLRLEDCYRWAYTGRKLYGGTLALHMKFDAVGVVSSLESATRIPDSQRLVECAEDVLSDAWLRRPSTRQVDTSFEIVFDPSDHVVGAEPVARPKRLYGPRAEIRSRSTATPSASAIDVVEIRQPIMTIRAALPQVRLGSVSRSFHYNRWLVHRGLRQNLGAYRACALAAAKRGTLGAQTVELVGSVDGFGTVRATLAAETSETKDLARCLETALAEVWFPALQRGVHPTRSKPPYQFRVAFKLLPNPTAAPVVRPEDLLDRDSRESFAANLLRRGDGHRAYNVYSELLANGANDSRECFLLAGGVKASILMAPWYDGRVTDSLQRMADYIGGLESRAKVGACVGTATSAVRKLAIRNHSTAMKLGQYSQLSHVADLYDWLLKMEPRGQHACEHRYYRAEALWQLAENGPEADRASEFREQAEDAFASSCAK